MATARNAVLGCQSSTARGSCSEIESAWLKLTLARALLRCISCSMRSESLESCREMLNRLVRLQRTTHTDAAAGGH